jgi:hypothetical protein
VDRCAAHPQVRRALQTHLKHVLPPSVPGSDCTARSLPCTHMSYQQLGCAQQKLPTNGPQVVCQPQGAQGRHVGHVVAAGPGLARCAGAVCFSQAQQSIYLHPPMFRQHQARLPSLMRRMPYQEDPDEYFGFPSNTTAASSALCRSMRPELTVMLRCEVPMPIPCIICRSTTLAAWASQMWTL